MEKKSKKVKTFHATPIQHTSKEKEENQVLPPDDEELDLETLIFGGSENKNISSVLANAGTELDGNDMGFFIDTGAEEETLKQQEGPAWKDNDQDDLQVDIQSKKRLRKLKTDFKEVAVDGDAYEQRLRQQFLKINPTPQWATLTGENVEKVQRDIFMTTKALTRTAPVLNPEKLDIVRLKDANHAEYSQVTLQTVGFHPTAPVMFTAGLDKTLRLFHIDGKDNAKVQSFFIRDMPIFSSSFSNDGSLLVLTGRRNFFYCLDVESGDIQRITGIRGILEVDKGRDEKSYEHSYISPCNTYLVVLGRDGYVILVSMTTKQWVANLKMNSSAVSVAFGPENNLFSLGWDGTVYQWDLDTKECLHKFNDQGCIKATSLAISRDGKWIAVGSSSGVVNLYDLKVALASPMPEPLKVVMNLTTAITLVKFHPSSDLLFLASNEVKDALRILHLPSLKVVKNWPTAATPLGYVSTLTTSPDGQFVVIGNSKGKALLYRLDAFSTTRR